MKVLKEFEVNFSDYLNYKQLKEAKSLINLHYLGDTECNHFVDGKYVAKYPEIEKQKPELMQAHYNVVRGFSAKATVQLMEDGTFRSRKIK